ncbi:unnamed protein product [Eretmochelys imbricata]
MSLLLSGQYFAGQYPGYQAQPFSPKGDNGCVRGETTSGLLHLRFWPEDIEKEVTQSSLVCIKGKGISPNSVLLRLEPAARAAKGGNLQHLPQSTANMICSDTPM